MTRDHVIIRKFISLGKLNPNTANLSEKELEELKLVANYSRYNGKGPDFWSEVTKNLTAEGLTHLIKGLTTAEYYYSWAGGSVASTIALFKIIEKKFPEEVEKIANWVLKNRGNSYLPFGGGTDAENYQQYLEQQRYKARKSYLFDIEEEKREKLRLIEKDEQKLQKENSSKDRKSDIRNKIIEKLKPLPITSRLNYIASDTKYTVNFYPTKWSHEANNDEVIQNLSKNTRIELLRKMKGKQKGPWGKFKKRLVETEPGLWNIKPVIV